MTSGPIRRESIPFRGSLVSDFRLTHLGIHDHEQAQKHVFPSAARRSWSKRPIPKDFVATHGSVALRPAFSGGLPLSWEQG
jgi:hypothetical protein